LPMADPSNVCKDDIVGLYERHARAYDRDRAARFRNVRGSTGYWYTCRSAEWFSTWVAG